MNLPVKRDFEPAAAAPAPTLQRVYNGPHWRAPIVQACTAVARNLGHSDGGSNGKVWLVYLRKDQILVDNCNDIREPTAADVFRSIAFMAMANDPKQNITTVRYYEPNNRIVRRLPHHWRLLQLFGMPNALVTVFHAGQHVLGTHMGPAAYKPGVWEEAVYSHLERALAKRSTPQLPAI
jgi:hypothetical protein